MENIQKLAAEIAAQTIIQSWPYYLLLIALTIVSSSFGAFFSSYMTRRAEQRAIQADFENIKSQLRETTILTESIRTELSHHFDRTHTIEVLRREKLETYVEKILEATENLSHEMNEKIFNSKVQYDTSAYSTASMLQAMYLPEFDEVHAKYAWAYSEFRVWLIEGMKYIAQRKSQGIQIVLVEQEYMNKYPAHLKKYLKKFLQSRLKPETLGGNLSRFK
jgi:hypothetical protein